MEIDFKTVVFYSELNSKMHITGGNSWNLQEYSFGTWTLVPITGRPRMDDDVTEKKS